MTELVNFASTKHIDLDRIGNVWSISINIPGYTKTLLLTSEEMDELEILMRASRPKIIIRDGVNYQPKGKLV